VSFGRFALVVLAVAGGSLGLLWPWLRRALDPSARKAAVLGASLAALNSLAAYFLVLWSTPRSTTTFFRAVLGGMLGRMALLLAAAVAAIRWLGLPALPLVVSLLAYFVLFLALELGVVARRPSLREAP
jgi:hypothetical protein